MASSRAPNQAFYASKDHPRGQGPVFVHHGKARTVKRVQDELRALRAGCYSSQRILAHLDHLDHVNRQNQRSSSSSSSDEEETPRLGIQFLGRIQATAHCATDKERNAFVATQSIERDELDTLAREWRRAGPEEVVPEADLVLL